MRYFATFMTAIAILCVVSNDVYAGAPPEYTFIDVILDWWDLMSGVFGS